jgi:hypothetical protein
MKRIDVSMWLCLVLAMPAGGLAMDAEQEDASNGNVAAAEPATPATVEEPPVTEEPSPPSGELALQTLTFTTEVSLRPPAVAGEAGGGLALRSECAGCEMKCFTHSCRVDCPTGRPDCMCRQIDTPTGKQFLPFCQCR